MRVLDAREPLHTAMATLIVHELRAQPTPSLDLPLPRGELMMMAGGTHVVPLERKDAVLERVEKFLRERVGV